MGPRSLQSKTILIVEDSASIRHLLRAPLEGAGFKTLEASGGEEALALLAGGTIDLFVLDLHMPGMDGLELLRRIRTYPQYASTMVFVVSADSDPLKQLEGQALGVSHWVSKPFRPRKLLDEIESALGAASST